MHRNFNKSFSIFFNIIYNIDLILNVTHATDHNSQGIHSIMKGERDDRQTFCSNFLYPCLFSLFIFTTKTSSPLLWSTFHYGACPCWTSDPLDNQFENICKKKNIILFYWFFNLESKSRGLNKRNPLFKFMDLLLPADPSYHQVLRN